MSDDVVSNGGSAAFDGPASDFAEYMQQAWGRLRAQMIALQLDRHLPADEVDVLDIGCGPGAMIEELRSRGRRFTGVDFSQQMIEVASHRLGPDDRVRLICADIHDLPSVVADGSFDLVLCHCVLEYVEDVDTIVGHAARAVRAGGLLSVLILNQAARVIKTAVVDLDPVDALAGWGRELHPNKVFPDTQTRMVDPARLVESLAHAGFSALATYGVRAFWDLLPRGVTPSEELYASMLDLEMRLCDVDPFRAIGNYHHLVALRAD